MVRLLPYGILRGSTRGWQYIIGSAERLCGSTGNVSLKRYRDKSDEFLPLVQ